MRRALFTITLTLATLFAFAQNLGHINTQQLLLKLPDYEKAKLELDAFKQEKQTEFQEYLTIYQKKEAAYLEKEAACSKDPDCDKYLLESEYNKVMESAKKIEELQYSMEMEIQERENYLINKVIEKIQKAAKAVADEKGILYVFDSSSLIYAGGIDLNEAVLAKLLEGSTNTAEGE